jgi:hypothetical protein
MILMAPCIIDFMGECITWASGGEIIIISTRQRQHEEITTSLVGLSTAPGDHYFYILDQYRSRLHLARQKQDQENI